ncbi:phosphatase PAP2 family protein [uncultured Methylobacterium sp.]|uniref:acid phosphatase n=1 Tax=uncultured Methylobacterium sp. TaxID=157278 RepID=UPI0035C9D0CD
MPRFLPARLLALLILGLLALPGRPASADPAPAPFPDPAPETSAPSVGADPVRPDSPARGSYLGAAAPDTTQILPPPPAPRSTLEAADRATFAATRALKGSPRWAIAETDVAEGAAAILDTFACVLGTRLDEARVPAVIGLLERARLDIAEATRGPKVHYRRPRPFVGNAAPICVQRTQALADSFSYPSGHATQGWAYALIVAALVPSKATAILVRGRAYGESRVICGVHWLSDVTAGRTNGAAVFAALMGDAAFRADMDRARTELGRALAGEGGAPDPALCRREAEGLASVALEF